LAHYLHEGKAINAEFDKQGNLIKVVSANVFIEGGANLTITGRSVPNEDTGSGEPKPGPP